MTVDNPVNRNYLPEQALLYRFDDDTMLYQQIDDEARASRAIALYGNMINYIED